MQNSRQQNSTSIFTQAPGQQVSNPREENGGQPTLDLTLSIEIEFLLLQDMALQLPQGANAIEYARRAVYEALNQELQAECHNCHQKREFQLRVNEFSDVSVDYSCWNINSDDTVSLNNTLQGDMSYFRDRVYGHPFEIASRILDIKKNLAMEKDQDECRHEVDYQEEIKAVTQALLDTFNIEGPNRGWQVMVNQSCGFHVHIGNGNKSFPLDTVKNLISLHVAGESAIDSMHAADRIQGSSLAFNPSVQGTPTDFWNQVLFDDVSNRPWSKCFQDLTYGHGKSTTLTGRAASVYPESHYQVLPDLDQVVQRNDIPSRLQILGGAGNISHLQQIPRDRWVTANTLNLKLYPPIESSDSKNTIEFRQHAGTLQSDEMLAFLVVLINMVQLSHRTTRSAMNDTCIEIWKDPKFELLRLLSLLGFDRSDETFRHYKVLTGLRRRPHYEFAYVYHQRLFRPPEGSLNDVRDVANAAVYTAYVSRVPLQVRRAIQEKFLAGCYGLFTPKYIDSLAYDSDWPSELLKYRLKVDSQANQ